MARNATSTLGAPHDVITQGSLAHPPRFPSIRRLSIRPASSTRHPPIRPASPTRHPPIRPASPTRHPPIRPASSTRHPPIRPLSSTRHPPIRPLSPTRHPPIRPLSSTRHPPISILHQRPTMGALIAFRELIHPRLKRPMLLLTPIPQTPGYHMFLAMHGRQPPPRAV